MKQFLYAIIAEDKPNSLADRKAARPEHLKRLHTLQEAGRLLLAGPCPDTDSKGRSPSGFTGSLIVAKFDSLSDAQFWASTDPYITSGVYEKVSVKPFIQVLPTPTD